MNNIRDLVKEKQRQLPSAVQLQIQAIIARLRERKDPNKE